jgi:hypothetical protein
MDNLPVFSTLFTKYEKTKIVDIPTILFRNFVFSQISGKWGDLPKHCFAPLKGFNLAHLIMAIRKLYSQTVKYN